MTFGADGRAGMARRTAIRGKRHVEIARGERASSHQPDGGKSEVIVTFHETEPPSVLVERGDRTVLGTQVRAASGAKYEGANLMFWEHQGEAQVTWMNVELKCKERK